MENDVKPFCKVVSDCLTKLKQVPGWRKKLFSHLTKSESTVANWRNGKTVASEEDQVEFLEVVNSIMRDHGSSQQLLKMQQSKLLEEFSELSAIQHA